MTAKTLEELLVDVREELDDEVPQYLWSDPALTRYLNEAVKEAAIRTRCLVESGNAALCQIAITAGQAEYAIDASVVIIRRAALASCLDRPLLRTTGVNLDRACRHWQTEAGRPEYLLRDQQMASIRLSPIPDADDTLNMTLWRVPTDIEVMEAGDDEPVIPAIHHEHLKHWACFRALNRRDAELGSPADAANHLALFEAYYGPRPTARELQQLAIDVLPSVEAHWF